MQFRSLDYENLNQNFLVCLLVLTILWSWPSARPPMINAAVIQGKILWITHDGIYIFASFWNMVQLLEKHSTKTEATNTVLIKWSDLQDMTNMWAVQYVPWFLTSRLQNKKIKKYRAQFTAPAFTVNLSFHLCCFISFHLRLSITPASIPLFLFCSALLSQRITYWVSIFSSR